MNFDLLTAATDTYKERWVQSQIGGIETRMIDGLFELRGRFDTISIYMLSLKKHGAKFQADAKTWTLSPAALKAAWTDMQQARETASDESRAAQEKAKAEYAKKPAGFNPRRAAPKF